MKESAVTGIKMPTDDITLGELSVKVIVSGSDESPPDSEYNYLLLPLSTASVDPPAPVFKLEPEVLSS